MHAVRLFLSAALMLALVTPAFAQVIQNSTLSPGSTQAGATATVTNVNAPTNINAPTNTTVGVNTQHQRQDQLQLQNNDQNIAPSQSVNFEGTRFDRYAPPVAAPALTSAGTGVCLGSVAIGISGPMAGLSFGITKVDTGCEQRSASALLWQYGYKDAAVRLLMNNDDVKAAMGAEGKKLTAVVGPVQTVSVAPAPAVVTPAAVTSSAPSACGPGAVLKPSGFCGWAK